MGKSIIDSIKLKFAKQSFKIFNGLMAQSQISDLATNLITPSWWNPITLNVFDADWAFPHLVEFMDEFTTMSHEVPVGTPYGLCMFGFTYEGCHYRVNFAPENPRVLTLSLIDIEPGMKNSDGSRVEFQDDSVLRHLQSIANEYNQKDLRHLVRVGFLGDDVSPVVRISTQIVFTPNFGDKMMIKDACDELFEYCCQFVGEGMSMSDVVNIPNNEYIFLPANRELPNDDSDFWKQENALEHWFGLHQRLLYGISNCHESGNKIICDIPAVFSAQNRKNAEAIGLPFNENGMVVELEESFLQKIKLVGFRNNPFLYTMEARNLNKLFEINNPISDNKIKELCEQLTWNDHNQLIRAVWHKGPDGNLDMSIIGSGLWLGPSQSFAKIDQIGEFMKNIAAAYLVLTGQVK